MHRSLALRQRRDFLPGSFDSRAAAHSANITIAQALEHSNISGDAATDGGLVKLGLGTLTLQSSTSALVEVMGGAHKINLPVTVASNTDLSLPTPFGTAPRMMSLGGDHRFVRVTSAWVLFSADAARARVHGGLVSRR